MIYAFIGITVLWLFLFCYIIIASIDFLGQVSRIAFKVNW